jgi:hypothetical protein
VIIIKEMSDLDNKKRKELVEICKKEEIKGYSNKKCDEIRKMIKEKIGDRTRVVRCSKVVLREDQTFSMNYKNTV